MGVHHVSSNDGVWMLDMSRGRDGVWVHYSVTWTFTRCPGASVQRDMRRGLLILPFAYSGPVSTCIYKTRSVYVWIGGVSRVMK